ncbi:MAG: TetR/AcrR family transcriptional regulator [Propionibacteriaceae bacterium]|jgi:AcrR family transcriptional regulator|nr:TetR/AcrR family transcriptional regulator [Propionibacteriaceae bacterium]
MDQGATEELGLRQRKKRETLVALHEAALSLAMERGLDGVTVQDIATRADVSPRTFFNYFENKDDAVLGISALATAEVLASFAAQEPVKPLDLDTIVQLIWQLLVSSILSESTLEDRMALLQANPSLARHSFDQLGRLEGRLIDALDARLAVEPGFASAAERRDHLMVLLSTSMGVWRYILHKLLDMGVTEAGLPVDHDYFTQPIRAFISARQTEPGGWIPDSDLIRTLQSEYLSTLHTILP